MVCALLWPVVMAHRHRLRGMQHLGSITVKFVFLHRAGRNACRTRWNCLTSGISELPGSPSESSGVKSDDRRNVTIIFCDFCPRFFLFTGEFPSNVQSPFFRAESAFLCTLQFVISLFLRLRSPEGTLEVRCARRWSDLGADDQPGDILG